MPLMGLLNICKIPGMSSHDVVARVRRLAGMKRVGHAGTLDPAACGVLLVCLGRATRLADYIADGSKVYRAEITLGVSSDSADSEGQIIAEGDASTISEAQVRDLIPRFCGAIQQRPPAHSAIQINGQRAYNLARQGIVVAIPAREVTIHSFSMLRFQAGSRARVLVDICCSKGTYIRSIARDLGDELGVGGTLTFLARTRINDCAIEDSLTLAELSEPDALAAALQSPDSALTAIPALTLAGADELPYCQGRARPFAAADGNYRVYNAQGKFLGLGNCLEDILRTMVNLFPE